MRAKASELIKAVGEPWIRRLGPKPTLEAVTGVYQIAAMVWNSSRLPLSRDREHFMVKIRELMRKCLPELNHDQVEKLFLKLKSKALDLYPTDHRHIFSVTVRQRTVEEFEILAVSARGTDVADGAGNIGGATEP